MNMQQFRRVMPVGLTLAATSALFASSASATTTIRFAGLLGYEKPAMTALVSGFEQVHPDIQVSLEYGTLGVGNSDALISQILGGKAPDLVWFNRVAIPEMAAAGVFMPLDPLTGSYPSLNPKTFIPGILQEGTYQGRLYGLPVSVDLFGMAWNQSLFAEAGLKPDAPPRTWDDVRQVAQKLTRSGADGSLSQAGIFPNDLVSRTWLYSQAAQQQVELVTADGRVHLDDPKLASALRYNTELAQSLGGWPVLSATKGSFGKSTFAMDLAREAASILGGMDQAKATFTVGVAPTPAPQDGRPVSYIGGWALAIPTGLDSEHLKAALTLMAWMLDPDHEVRRFQLNGGLGFPPNQPALQRVSTALSGMPHTAALQSYIALAEIAVPRGTSPINIDALKGLEAAAKDALSGKTDPLNALREQDRILQAKLDELAAKAKG